MKKTIIGLVFILLMAVPVQAHLYDDDFEAWSLGPIRPQSGSGSGTWWGNGSPEAGNCDAEVELDPAIADHNDNQVLNVAGPMGGASLGDDLLWIHGFGLEPNEGTWIVAEFDLYLSTLDWSLGLYFYDNDSSDPAVSSENLWVDDVLIPLNKCSVRCKH